MDIERSVYEEIEISLWILLFTITPSVSHGCLSGSVWRLTMMYIAPLNRDQYSLSAHLPRSIPIVPILTDRYQYLYQYVQTDTNASSPCQARVCSRVLADVNICSRILENASWHSRVFTSIIEKRSQTSAGPWPGLGGKDKHRYTEPFQTRRFWLYIASSWK